MRLGSPYGPCSNTFPRIPHTAHKLQKTRLQFRRDQRPALADQAPTGPLKSPEPASHLRRFTRPANSLKPPGGHGYGDAAATASLRRVDDTGGAAACLCWSGLRPGSPGNRGRPDPAKSRRRGAGSRRTDDGSRRPGPASRVRYAVGVPYLYLFEYLLQRFFDSFQFVVCLFLAFNKDVKPAVYSAVKHPCEYPQHAPLALYRY